MPGDGAARIVSVDRGFPNNVTLEGDEIRFENRTYISALYRLYLGDAEMPKKKVTRFVLRIALCLIHSSFSTKCLTDSRGTPSHPYASP